MSIHMLNTILVDGDVIIFPADYGASSTDFSVATEKALAPTFVLTLGTKSGLKLDDWTALQE